MIFLQVVRVWDPRSGSKTMKLKGHTDNIRALLLDSSGRLVLRSIDFYMEMFLEIFCILFCILGFVLVYQIKGEKVVLEWRIRNDVDVLLHIFSNPHP